MNAQSIEGALIDTDITRGLAMPKTSSGDVAMPILDGIEAGQEDIYSEPFPAAFHRHSESSPEVPERRFAAMAWAAAA